MNPTQEKAAGEALRKFLALIKTDQGRGELATHPKAAIGPQIWADLPPPLTHFLERLNKPELEGLNSVADSFTPDGLLVMEEPSETVSHVGFATLCKF